MPEETAKTKQFTSEKGNEYTFQMVDPVPWMDIMDEVEANKEKPRRTLYPKVLEEIVVQPKMKLDDFETYAEMEEVVTAALRFQRGK